MYTVHSIQGLLCTIPFNRVRTFVYCTVFLGYRVSLMYQLLLFNSMWNFINVWNVSSFCIAGLVQYYPSVRLQKAKSDINGKALTCCELKIINIKHGFKCFFIFFVKPQSVCYGTSYITCCGLIFSNLSIFLINGAIFPSLASTIILEKLNA